MRDGRGSPRSAMSGRGSLACWLKSRVSSPREGEDAMTRDGSNWHALVRERAAMAGIQLPPSTVDELALHLEDLYVDARSGGLAHEAAAARAIASLAESG